MIYGIFGHHTGGTSAVAGVVYLHGIQMWGEPKTLDDVELKAAIDTHTVHELFPRRTGEWAFKHPLIADQAQYLIDTYQVQPIYVYRDPVAIWMNSGKNPTPEQIKRSTTFFKRLAGNSPGLFVSYEKLQTETERVCRQIADYIDKPFNPKCLEWVNNERKYVNVADFL